MFFTPDVFLCGDCGMDTSTRAGICEYYMVHHSLWDYVNGGTSCLCIGCLESRLGRKLFAEDFLRCPVNDSRTRRRSLRLRTRMRTSASSLRPRTTR